MQRTGRLRARRRHSGLGLHGLYETVFCSSPAGARPVNPDHSHAPGFTTMCDADTTGKCRLDACDQGTNCYSYVQKSDVQQYFDIATTYGFANYMFQTNEGPSFPARQFLFSGTSGPTGISGQNDYNWFAAENLPQYFVNHTDTGCSSPDSQDNMDVVKGIDFS